MGVVYRAHDPDLGRDVALKVIRPAVEAAEEGPTRYEQRFFNEARAAARLSHPAIVVVHDVGRDPASGALFMALELLRGHTLQAIIRDGGPLPWRDALSLVERVAEGLHHAHEGGIVHRDVKPANIMVLESGQPKVMDFGIAKVEASQLTATGQLFGTPLYMSPEQALGRPVDARSDVFSLGAVLYEMLSGRRAFAGDSVHHIVLQVVEGKPRPATSLVPDLPRDLDYVLARCLAKEPARRYPSGRALAEDLRDILSGARPRGRDSWQAPEEPKGERTLVSAPGGLPAARATARATLLSSKDAVGARAAGRLVSSNVKLLLAAALLAAAAGAGYLARSTPSPTAAQPVPSPVSTATTPAVVPAPPATVSASSPAPPSALDRVGALFTRPDPAQLVIDFEHTLKTGTLRVWVDEKLVIEERLDSRITKSIAGLKLRKGRLQGSLDVNPGRHEVRVQVAWEDSRKTESIWANFKPGTKQELQARLRGIGGLRDLSLKWR
jgi:serine/threonine-protein kinase